MTASAEGIVKSILEVEPAMKDQAERLREGMEKQTAGVSEPLLLSAAKGSGKIQFRFEFCPFFVRART